MSRITFLKKREALGSQVAGFLWNEGSRDLSDTEVWVPTAGAGRRIRRALAGYGVLSPRFTQPMRALLPGGVRIAENFEREGAWALALETLDRDFLEPLFSGARLDSEPARLKSAGVLCDVCDLLAEAGCSPADPRMADICGEDAARWEVLGRVYQCYLAVLKDLDLVDPNEARFDEVAGPTRANSARRVVIACIPDLPLLAQRYAEVLENWGVRVDVLVWMPGEMAGGFDAWGRPLSGEWAECRVAIEVNQISVARSPGDEAKQAFDFALAADPPGDYAVVLADPDLGGTFRGEVESRGGKAFLPDGGRLDLSEAGIMAIEWPRFQSTGDLRVLRRLLELPRFSRVVRSGSEFKPDDALAVCDYLIGEVVLSDIAQAEAFAKAPFDAKKEKSKRRPQVGELIESVKAVKSWTVPEVLANAWRSGGEGLESARNVVQLHQAISSSPLYEHRVAAVDHALARALKSEPVFGTSLSGEVELSGWLEAPWLEAGRLALCGCVEGGLPSSVNGHPFLPDSKRKALGLADNDSRFARDAYLFQCLLLARPQDSFRCSFSRFDAEGSPTMPSRMFLRCGEDALPERVHGLFGKLPGGASRVRRENQWKWSLPGGKRKEIVKMSPTDFSEYLACPFRFYLKKVLWLDTFASDAREMDARRFGTLVHEALETFGRETPDESDPEKIERLVLGHLEASVGNLFGSLPSPAVRVQIEAAKMRLRGFARVQAQQFASGWRIVSTERKLEHNGDRPLPVGPLALSGKIDRIEKNISTGEWRVVDYKTHAKADPPARKHFGPRLASEWLPSAEVEFHNGRKDVKKRWVGLQLPLYSVILRHWHGTEIGEARVSTAYFSLSADPSETAVMEFTELNGDVMASAIACAGEVASLVRKGVFWPPQPLKTSWDDPFEALFLNGKPEHCISEETIELLKGDK